ncbi:hypothetical protein ACNAW0_30180, partial [Micromonospora sp. SL1-18]|uniref:hypothetical protein n=1 Tax=Micromonospora sp. SL1-18 TaxID=3399128 RepID=UPI003A4D30EB
EDTMDVLHDRCAALDVAKDEVKVCLRTPGKRRNTLYRAKTRRTGCELLFRDKDAGWQVCWFGCCT